MLRHDKALAVLSLSIPLATACAQPVAITNPGFEVDPAPPAGYTIRVPTGWSLVDPNFIVDQGGDAVGCINTSAPQTFFPGGCPEGDQAALIYLASQSGGGEVGLRQTLSHTLQARSRYTLRVAVGNIATGFGPPGNTFYNLDGFPGYRVDLFAGNVLIARDNDSLSGLIPEGQFRDTTLVADIGAEHPGIGRPLTIVIVNLNRLGTPQSPGIEVDFDHIRLDRGPFPPLCPADFNGDTFVDGFDYDDFVACFEGAPCPPGKSADFTSDGFVDGFDYDAFVEAFEVGC